MKITTLIFRVWEEKVVDCERRLREKQGRRKKIRKKIRYQGKRKHNHKSTSCAEKVWRTKERKFVSIRKHLV